MAKVEARRRDLFRFAHEGKDGPAVTRQNPLDQTDPNSAGITADELVATVAGIALRRIRYAHPATGEEYEFLTSEFTLPPGVIAFLYLRRWDLEKVFDELKNRLSAKRAWASTAVAQEMQAHLLCLAHNLIQLFERHLAAAHQLRNVAEEKRRARRLSAQQTSATARGAALPALVQTHQRLTQTSLKLFRWLRRPLLQPASPGRAGGPSWHAPTPTFELNLWTPFIGIPAIVGPDGPIS